MVVAIIFSLVLVGFGIAHFAAPDFVWSLTRLGNDWEGEASHRSDLWELRRVLTGAFMIIAGIILFIVALSIGPGSADGTDDDFTYTWTYATPWPTSLPAGTESASPEPGTPLASLWTMLEPTATPAGDGSASGDFALGG